MSEETGLEAWEREKKEGVPFKERLYRFIHDFGLITLLWIMTVPMSLYMVNHFGTLFTQVFIIVLALLTILMAIGVRQRWKEYDGLMAIVAEMHSKEKEVKKP